MKNNVQLITYVDRLTSSGITALKALLEDKFDGIFSGVHILPFYHPIDGSDAGFDPIDHTLVDSRLGDWHDIKALGQDTELMVDLIVNHISAQSKEFMDVLANGEQSIYWDLFLTKNKLFPEGLTDEQKNKIYRPRPGSCFTTYNLPNNNSEDFWTTFTSNQIDIDITSEVGKKYLANILTLFSQHNVKMIRLDAAGYAIKKAGTSCFMLDETFDFINQLSQDANAVGVETLVEIHSYYQTQIAIAERVDWVYDFALPPLILHSIFTQDFTALAKWLTISPKNCITVLDTHDGIGIVDVGPMNGKAGLLDETEIDHLVNTIHLNSHGESKKATGEAASNVDLYQVNCTYFDALKKNEYHYLIARAIQFFAPGIPQVYYAGLFAETNDMALLAKTNIGRDINRPYFDQEKLQTLFSKPFTQAMLSLIKVRNNSNAFNGEFKFSAQNANIIMSWQQQTSQASLSIDLKNNIANIYLNDGKKEQTLSLRELLPQ